MEEEEKDMFCTNCGRELKENWIRCPECGLAITQNKQQPKELKKKGCGSRLIYGFIAIVMLLGVFSISGMGSVVDSILEVIQYVIGIVVYIAIPLLLISNSGHIRDKLPLFKEHKIGHTILASFLTLFFLSTMGVGLELGSDMLHTEQYRMDVERAKKEEQVQVKSEGVVTEKKATMEKVAEEKKTTEEKKAESKAAADKEIEEAKKAVEEAKKESQRILDEFENDPEKRAEKYTPTQLEEIQTAFDWALKVEPEELMRTPSKYDNETIAVTDELFIGMDETLFIYIAGEKAYIYPKKVVDEQANSVENLLDSDKITIIGDFQFHSETDITSEKVSTIKNAIIILRK